MRDNLFAFELQVTFTLFCVLVAFELGGIVQNFLGFVDFLGCFSSDCLSFLSGMHYFSRFILLADDP